MDSPIGRWCRGLRATAAAAALAFAFACSQEEAKAPEPRAVTVVRVEAGVLSDEVAYSGEVRARYETSLAFRVPGKIVARLVEVGESVNPGAVLARLDPEDQKLNQEAAVSQLAAAQADYEQARVDLARYQDLLQKKFISEAEFDRRRTIYDVAKARLEQAQAQLGVTQNQAAYTRLRSDHGGVITAIQAEVGQVVAAGQTVMHIARSGEKEVVISVPENKLAELTAAREIAVTLWAVPDRKYRGRVREVSPAADPVTRTYAARISVTDADAAMKLGMTANAYLRGISRGALFELPATAVFKQGSGAAVWLFDPRTNQVRAVPVEVARYYEDKVSVQSGLNDGDIVVRAGVHKLFDGEKVRVLQESGA